MNTHPDPARIESELNRLQQATVALSEAINRLNIRFEKVEKANELQDKDFEAVNTALVEIRSTIEKLEGWRELISPSLLENSRFKQDIGRLENKISELYDAISKMNSLIEQRVFVDRQTEKDIIAMKGNLMESERALESQIDSIRASIKEDYVSKRDLLSQQQKLLWGVVGFVATSLISWALSKL